MIMNLVVAKWLGPHKSQQPWTLVWLVGASPLSGAKPPGREIFLYYGTFELLIRCYGMCSLSLSGPVSPQCFSSHSQGASSQSQHPHAWHQGLLCDSVPLTSIAEEVALTSSPPPAQHNMLTPLQTHICFSHLLPSQNHPLTSLHPHPNVY